ncbi:MAG: ABC transporter ATP-binding protein [Clostridia bacterium]|nr:ABC transporter ATP-binding protein [Clostridia bacterium]
MIIQIVDLCFSYNKSKKILENVTYIFESGKAYILSGANGSGKTTLTRLIMGLLKPNMGSVSIDNEPLINPSKLRLADKIGYLFQNTDMQLFANTVYEELAFPYQITGAYNNDIENKIDITLKEFGLDGLYDRFPLLLSGGEKQRLALATIFIRDVQFLILDEPSSSIDQEGKIFLAELINRFVEQGGGVIVISHDEELKDMINNPVHISLNEGRL